MLHILPPITETNAPKALIANEGQLDLNDLAIYFYQRDRIPAKSKQNLGLSSLTGRPRLVVVRFSEHGYGTVQPFLNAKIALRSVHIPGMLYGLVRRRPADACPQDTFNQ